MKALITVAGIAALMVGLSAQSAVQVKPRPSALAKAAAGAEQQRKDRAGRAKASKVYTNTDLRFEDEGVPLAVVAPAPGTPQGTPMAATGVEQLNASGKDEAYWKDRMRTLQARLAADQDQAAALSRQLGTLVADYDAAGAYLRRVVIEQELIRTRRDLLQSRATVRSDERAIANLEEEARRAGVPAGWLRF